MGDNQEDNDADLTDAYGSLCGPRLGTVARRLSPDDRVAVLCSLGYSMGIVSPERTFAPWGDTPEQ